RCSSGPGPDRWRTPPAGTCLAASQEDITPSVRSTAYGEAMMPVSMVGRASEVGELVRAWDRVTAQVRAGTATGGRAAPRTAVITGAAGLGKSLLVSAALDAFTPRPATVLSGTARVHTPAPYDWLAAVLGGRDTHELRVPPDALAWL